VASARPPGPASAYAAELALPGIADQVLAAGIADERFDPDILEAAALGPRAPSRADAASRPGSLSRPAAPGRPRRLILPAVIADITRFIGLSDSRPTLTGMSVSELPG
jgi:hypothetical protein